MSEKAYRYPGAQPFQGSQQDIFFGREMDIEDFYELLILEQHVILYSKSGLGKSSLLNAGVIPKIKAEGNHLPILIRFGAYSENKVEMPVDTTAQILGAYTGNDLILDKIIENEQSLWYHTKNLQQQQLYDSFILIFDQFEELFSYPEEAIFEFKKQLAELIHTEIPNRFREVFGHQFQGEGKTVLSEEELDFVHQPVEVKVVMSIRSDRMSLLNNLSDYLPNILRTWYELDALTVEQAEEAILNPAYKKDSRFITTPFDYSDEAIEGILNYLTKGRKEKIESFQLQILCQAFERKVIDEQLNKLTVAHLDKLELIYENYYENQINLLATESEKQSARQLIEEGLIFEEEKRRLSMYEGQIYKLFGFTPELLGKLVNVHLLRAEPSLKGGYTYELSHDTIVNPILKAKRKRKTAEKIRAEKQAQREREKEIELLREQAESERRKRMRARAYAVLGITLAIIAITSSIYAGKMASKAKQQVFSLVKADYSRLLADGKRLQRDGMFDEAVEQFRKAEQRIAEFGSQIDNGGLRAKKAIVAAESLKAKSVEYDSLFSTGKQLFEAGDIKLVDALNHFEAAHSLNVSPERNKQAVLEIKETKRAITRAYERYLELGERFRDVGEIGLACSSYKTALSLKPEEERIQKLVSNTCQ